MYHKNALKLYEKYMRKHVYNVQENMYNMRQKKCIEHIIK